MPQLFVNVDHVATLRQARRGQQPCPFDLAERALAAGAAGITMHLREDRRHVQDADLIRFAEEGKAPLNFELAVWPEILELCERLRPAIATLVPEKREEVTTEGGLDLRGQASALRPAIARLEGAGIRVSLFVDPTPENAQRARELGASAVELHTGSYANAANGTERAARLQELVISAAAVNEAGLVLNAGHGLDSCNVGPVAAIEGMIDLNIGHALIARSLTLGIDAAVREMLEAMRV